jgi:hypothetical protein
MAGGLLAGILTGVLAGGLDADFRPHAVPAP